MIGLVLFIVMIIATAEIVRRFPKDLAEFINADNWVLRGVIAFFWALALLFLGSIGRWLWIAFSPLLK